jgi:hypothetical protein
LGTASVRITRVERTGVAVIAVHRSVDTSLNWVAGINRALVFVVAACGADVNADGSCQRVVAFSLNALVRSLAVGESGPSLALLANLQRTVVATGASAVARDALVCGARVSVVADLRNKLAPTLDVRVAGVHRALVQIVANLRSVGTPVGIGACIVRALVGIRTGFRLEHTPIAVLTNRARSLRAYVRRLTVGRA